MNLLVILRLHDGRFHGEGDWPPSPARLFQALLAGAAGYGVLAPDAADALRWLERREAPLIAAPAAWRGQRLMFYLPNNDLDAVGNDPRRVAEIRSAKKFSTPYLFDSAIPFIYAWRSGNEPDTDRQFSRIREISDELYQFGRGVDMAYASTEVIDDVELECRLSAYPGRVLRPSIGGSGASLRCPCAGSLDSLIRRHAENRARFGDDRAGIPLFTQASKPRFTHVVYGSPPTRRAYELRECSGEASFRAWPLRRAYHLVSAVRDAAAERLREALPRLEVERALIGRKSDGTNGGATSARVRIQPLPSIGHRHADYNIRRLLVEVPSECSLHPDDVYWALSGLNLVNQETGEVLDVMLTAAVDSTLPLRHFGISSQHGFRVWRTVTPTALPENAQRRRIEPSRRALESKRGAERAAEDARAAWAVSQSLRHAGVDARAQKIRVQREPFEGNGERAEAFSSGTRFPKTRLWHVEITFDRPVQGPLVIGDGRFLGLGVMAPIRRKQGLHVLTVEAGLSPEANPLDLTRALRRAVMARVQAVQGARGSTKLPPYFSGHETDASPARSKRNPHLAFTFDPGTNRFLIIAPHVLSTDQAARDDEQYLADLDEALENFRELRAGRAGLLTIRAGLADQSTDPLFAAAQIWESITPYQATRHARNLTATQALALDLRTECDRRGLPEPVVTCLESCGVPSVGLIGRVRLTFHSAVEGPIVLGRNRHVGGGLFIGVESNHRRSWNQTGTPWSDV